MKRLTLILFYLFFAFCSRAQKQDLIITTADFKIYCKIVKEDSLSIFYNIDNHNTTLEIKKTEVKAYYYNLIRQKKKKSPPPNSEVTKSNYNDDLFQFDLIAGVPVAVSDFGSKNVQSETAGLAKAGFLLQGGITFKLIKNIGICAAYHHQENRIADYLINEQIILINNGIPFTTESTNWVASGLFAGLTFEEQFEKVKGLSIFLKGMIGKPRFRSPEIISTASIFSFSVKQSAATARELGYMLGAGLMYKFNEDAGLRFSVNYFAGKPNFTNVIISNSQGGRFSAEFAQAYSTVNFQIGLTICIGRD